MVNSWVVLSLAIVLEVCGTICLKLSHGMTRPLPVIGVVLFYLSTFTLMSFCLKHLEVGTVYAVWSGAGTALVAMIGILYFGEGLSILKLLGLFLVIAGVILLHQSST